MCISYVYKIQLRCVQPTEQIPTTKIKENNIKTHAFLISNEEDKQTF